MIDVSVAVGFVFLALLGLILLWQGPKWQVDKSSTWAPEERFDRENEARKTLATILGGIVLLTGGFFTWRNITLAQRALAVAQEGQITDRFTKAIEQLGAIDSSGKKKLEVRLGGIYALERIADESERDHWEIIEILSTYIRENAPVSQQGLAQPKQPSSAYVPTSRAGTDYVQAIITIIGRRNRKYEPTPRRLNLRDTNLSDLRLVGNFSLVNLIGVGLTSVTPVVQT